MILKGFVPSQNQTFSGSAVELLPVPPPIKDFLLFCDLDAEAMIKQYKDTMDHVSNNGSANVLVI